MTEPRSAAEPQRADREIPYPNVVLGHDWSRAARRILKKLAFHPLRKVAVETSNSLIRNNLGSVAGTDSAVAPIVLGLITMTTDPDVFPNSLEYWGPTGMVSFRNVQVRWRAITAISNALGGNPYTARPKN